MPAAKKPAEPAAPSPRVRLSVRTAPAHGEMRRYRAGLGPFTREPQVVEAESWQAYALKSDPALVVTEVEG